MTTLLPGVVLLAACATLTSVGGQADSSASSAVESAASTAAAEPVELVSGEDACSVPTVGCGYGEAGGVVLPEGARRTGPISNLEAIEAIVGSGKDAPRAVAILVRADSVDRLIGGEIPGMPGDRTFWLVIVDAPLEAHTMINADGPIPGPYAMTIDVETGKRVYTFAGPGSGMAKGTIRDELTGMTVELSTILGS